MSRHKGDNTRKPIRTCIMCGAKMARADLLRIGAVDGHPAWDPRKRLPGRGAYVCPTPRCLEGVTANPAKRLQRALRGHVGASGLDKTGWEVGVNQQNALGVK